MDILTKEKKILDVPYFPQYNIRTCQTAVLKMFAEYLIRKKGAIPDASKNLSIDGIRAELESMGEPKLHDNWVKWIKETFGLNAEKFYSFDKNKSIDFIIRHINKGYPVIASVSHANNSNGHVILVVGYEQEKQTGWEKFPDTTFFIHDPYGRYDPKFEGERGEDYGHSRDSYDRVYVTEKSNLQLKYGDVPDALRRPEKGEYLDLSITSIRRNSSRDKKNDDGWRFLRYELISIIC